MDWLLALRCLLIVGSVYCLYLLSVAHYRQWLDWNNRTRHDWWALTAWVFLCVESTIEHLIVETPPGPRLVITSLALIYTIRSLTISQQLKAEPIVPLKKE